MSEPNPKGKAQEMKVEAQGGVSTPAIESPRPAPQRCIHCDSSFVPTGPDDWCYCVCHEPEVDSLRDEELSALVATRFLGSKWLRPATDTYGDGGAFLCSAENLKRFEGEFVEVDDAYRALGGYRESSRYWAVSPATDIASAMQVVEKLRADDPSTNIEMNSGTALWECKIWNTFEPARGVAKSLPRAICLAALQACASGVAPAPLSELPQESSFRPETESPESPESPELAELRAENERLMEEIRWYGNTIAGGEPMIGSAKPAQEACDRWYRVTLPLLYRLNAIYGDLAMVGCLECHGRGFNASAACSACDGVGMVKPKDQPKAESQEESKAAKPR